MRNAIHTSRAADAPAADRAEPVVVISDLHLSGGRRWRTRAARLRRLWAGARTIVFNGDTLSPAVAAEGTHREILGWLSEFCAQDGTQAIFLAGNTDFFLEAPQHLMLAEGRVLVTHGEVVFPNSSPWRSAPGKLREARQAALGEMAPERRGMLEGQLAAVRQAHVALKSPSKSRFAGLGLPFAAPLTAVRLLRAWRVAPGLALRFLNDYAPEAKCIVMGHTHWPGVWRQPDRAVVNTGSFSCPSRPWAACVAQGELSVRKLVRDRGDWVFGKETARFPLQG